MSAQRSSDTASSGNTCAVGGLLPARTMRRGTWLRTARARTPRSARRTGVCCKNVLWEAPGMSATIVVVDDDPLTLTLVERSLRAGGYRVWTASSAEEARQLLQDLAGAVDLVLTDIAMPGGLGTDLARQIGTTQRWVRVLLMTSYTKEDLERQGLEVPEAHLLRKPFAPARLLGRIREALAT